MENLNVFIVIIIMFVVAYFAKLYLFGNKNILANTKNLTKGSRIIVLDGYPNLMLFLTINDKLGVGIFDKDFKDYVGNPTKEELVKQLNQNNVYDFDKMNVKDFVKQFGKKLGDDKATELYYKYRSFSIGQLYGIDMDISKKEFIHNFGNDIQEMGMNSSDVYDKLKNANNSTIKN